MVIVTPQQGVRQPATPRSGVNIHLTFRLVTGRNRYRPIEVASNLDIQFVVWNPKWDLFVDIDDVSELPVSSRVQVNLSQTQYKNNCCIALLSIPGLLKGDLDVVLKKEKNNDNLIPYIVIEKMSAS
ncbi:hypothetical protein CAPTEDRAFT_194098 [Capitella teleta]|uniref:Uncharacterized protein n=1 Tax=Capitella teleta TaxID=283909 RepID=R7U472_CAPTE|nr:hypothetical protein CAPTEDRAFT_194098 [Capitella teleta]|eukprot:ELU00906.1 hypothetical protein CAPTEDRAFT_194098 [Capitella teleta]